MAISHALCRIRSSLSNHKQSPPLFCRKPISSSRTTGSPASSQPQTDGSAPSQPTVSGGRSSSGNPLGSSWPRLTPCLPHSPAPQGSQTESQAPRPQPSAATHRCQWLCNHAWPGPMGRGEDSLGEASLLLPSSVTGDKAFHFIDSLDDSGWKSPLEAI